MNAEKIEYMCFNKKGDISTVNGSSLKLVDRFTYHRSNVLSTENDINMRLVKAWTVIDSLSIIWYQTYPIKNAISSKQRLCQFYYIDAPHGLWLSVWRKS